MRRGNRHLVGVVLGGRSGGSRDAIMRNLLAENLEKAATRRTVAAISERSPSDANADVAEDQAESRPTQTVQVQGAVQVASAAPEEAAPMRTAPVTKPSIIANATAALPSAPAKPEPAPLTSGVIQTQQIAAIPGSSEPMKPVRVKTVQVKAGQIKLASASAAQPATAVTNAISPARSAVPETSGSVVAKAELNKAELPPQPAGHGTGHGVLGVLAVSSVPPSQAMASADPSPRTQPQAIQQNGAIKPVAARTGWIIQVGALETEGEARQRLEAARDQARGLLGKADSFTEPVVARGERKLFRARFAGLDRDQAEAVCRTLKRSDISCITIRN
jgi:D-alanyl-D-alanine carboxypeptidase